MSIQPRPRGPVIQEVRPLASTGGEVTILVSDLQPQPVTVLCRSGGRQHELDITSRRRGVSGSLSLVSVL